jgi:hypothetical protein
MAARLSGLDFAGRLPMPEAGVDRPDSSLTLKLASGATAKLTIGRDAGGGRFYAATDQGDVVYLIGGSAVRALFADVATLEAAEATEAAPQAVTP